ncbi:hypothetical protein [Pseudanabaena sp. UWO310]|uniref:hypothetical protein n=1 Tax=Pseudanabaena sp. UWO310 TaxID=2480795 RepID=UPI001159B7C2|nr:hypothetical protein [Pseudanabaena sp. UWO310]TYQ30906.1 hypothetical protein PseudUWO310_06060 [Pseudanabaena sp. UWO310]
MKKRNRFHQRNSWLDRLKKLWRSLVKLLQKIFRTDADKTNSRQSTEISTGRATGRVTSQSPSQLNSQLNSQLTSPTDFHEPIDRVSLGVLPRPTPFLLGLEDIQDLEILSTKDLIAQIEWNAESQQVLTVKEEDLTLLEDLLVNFPES